LEDQDFLLNPLLPKTPSSKSLADRRGTVHTSRHFAAEIEDSVDNHGKTNSSKQILIMPSTHIEIKYRIKNLTVKSVLLFREKIENYEAEQPYSLNYTAFCDPKIKELLESHVLKEPDLMVRKLYVGTKFSDWDKDMLIAAMQDFVKPVSKNDFKPGATMFCKTLIKFKNTS